MTDEKFHDLEVAAETACKKSDEAKQSYDDATKRAVSACEAAASAAISQF